MILSTTALRATVLVTLLAPLLGGCFGMGHTDSFTRAKDLRAELKQQCKDAFREEKDTLRDKYGSAAGQMAIIGLVANLPECQQALGVEDDQALRDLTKRY